MGKINAPEPINSQHNIELFDCQKTTLNHWLKNRAQKNEEAGASRTYVIHQDNRVIGYYCLSTGSLLHEDAPKKIKKNMPNPIPIIILGRLAIDYQWQRKGLGKALLKDALQRTLLASQHIGVRALLVHALSEEAARFYEYHQFIMSPIDPMIWILPL